MTLNKNSFYAKFYRRFVDSDLPTYFCTLFWRSLLIITFLPVLVWNIYYYGWWLPVMYIAGFLVLLYPVKRWLDYWPTIEPKVCKKIGWV